MNDTHELVHLGIADKIATITLDSQHNRNALSRQLVGELIAHLVSADADDSCSAILIRSAGSVFCSGADLAEAAADGMEVGARALIALQRQIAAGTKPVVVEVGGAVRAGGLGILGAADIVIAADSVSFQLTEVRLALAPAAISVTLIPRFTERAAAELFLTARAFDAAEAATIGLVTRAVPDGELAGAVQAVLDDLGRAHPQGLRETKRLLNHDLVARIDQWGDDMATRSATLFGSEAAKAAMRAFLERKR